MAWDSDRHQVVLFGGNCCVLLDDTWVWGAPLSSPIVRTPPFDFFQGCIGSSENADKGAHSAAIQVSNPRTGALDLNVQAMSTTRGARPTTGTATGMAGVGVYYTASHTGILRIRATVRISPPSFDLVYSTGAPKIGKVGIAGVESFVFISTSPPVSSLDKTGFRSSITTPAGSISEIYRFTSEHDLVLETVRTVTQGQTARVCAGITSTVTSTSFPLLVPVALTMGKVLYKAQVLKIELIP
jgi:hypothetical protein